MRTILSTIALFSLCGLCAQEYTPTYGRELPRGEILAYPSAEAATAADGGDNRYFTRLTEWNLKDNVFSTPFTVPLHGPTGRCCSNWDGRRATTKCA